MTAKQISIFIENQPKSLSELTTLLATNEVNLRALSLADSKDFGIVRIVSDDVYRASTVLKEAGYVYKIQEVIVLNIKDQAGELANVLTVLGSNEINVDYMYAFAAKKEKTVNMVLRISDYKAATEVFLNAGLHPVGQDEIEKYQIYKRRIIERGF